MQNCRIPKIRIRKIFIKFCNCETCSHSRSEQKANRPGKTSGEKHKEKDVEGYPSLRCKMTRAARISQTSIHLILKETINTSSNKMQMGMNYQSILNVWNSIIIEPLKLTTTWRKRITVFRWRSSLKTWVLIWPS